DIITCDDDGMITEFKVMLRPQRAVEVVRESMAAMLEQMTG
ncbi:MAG: nuclear transport factor 2 family protein, partial [Ilumatobacter sp.]|nr:nuclear transport factor 2 family protein [Ilumatobacter sp.]